MDIDAGKLIHRVTIESKGRKQDPSSGEMIDGWNPVAEGVACHIHALSARELIAAQQVQSKISARITMRWRPNIDSSMRIIHTVHGRQIIYNIEGVIPDPDTGLQYITLPVSTGVNNG